MKMRDIRPHCVLAFKYLDGAFSSLSQADNDTLSGILDVLDVGYDEERKLLIS